jgi:hypothetical protein
MISSAAALDRLPTMDRLRGWTGVGSDSVAFESSMPLAPRLRDILFSPAPFSTIVAATRWNLPNCRTTDWHHLLRLWFLRAKARFSPHNAGSPLQAIPPIPTGSWKEAERCIRLLVRA